ncbi:MAG: aminotransferase class I/II-fold pyridoxal phosphate-dependent enzyme, partial [Bryobacteraceae bacterium]|nr:aminotransferase class I/II-fold pyridoxal phosphate-dependent enzyme [Bryobacteraceae bacterium]
PAQSAGIAALSDREFLHRSLELNARGLRYLAKNLAELGLEVVPSEANFLMIALASAEQAGALSLDLLQQGIIVRQLGAFGLPQCIRISTGTDEENELCVQALRRSYAAISGKTEYQSRH